MTSEFQFAIAPDGRVTGIYDDGTAEFFRESGHVSIARASFVEPDVNGEWTADLAPSGGPVLGPYKLREKALQAERDWLEKKMFGHTRHGIKTIQISTNESPDR